MILTLFFITSIACEITYYISPSGLSTNNGLTKDKPLNWNWNNILKKLILFMKIQMEKPIHLLLFFLKEIIM